MLQNRHVLSLATCDPYFPCFASRADQPKMLVALHDTQSMRIAAGAISSPGSFVPVVKIARTADATNPRLKIPAPIRPIGLR